MEKKNVINRALAAKKLYSCPQIEVLRINTLLLQAFGEASMPSNPFDQSGAPERRSGKEPAF